MSKTSSANPPTKLTPYFCPSSFLPSENGDSIGEFGGIDKIEGEEVEEIEETVHQNGQKLQC